MDTTDLTVSTCGVDAAPSPTLKNKLNCCFGGLFALTSKIIACDLPPRLSLNLSVTQPKYRRARGFLSVLPYLHAIMSLLSPEIHAELTQLLQALQSPDNAIRSQAEEHLQNNWTSTRPEVLLMGLAEQVQGAQEVAVS